MGLGLKGRRRDTKRRGVGRGSKFILFVHNSQILLYLDICRLPSTEAKEVSQVGAVYIHVDKLGGRFFA